MTPKLSRIVTSLLCAAGTLAIAQSAPQHAPARLTVSSPMQLVNCAPVTLVPCMSMGVTAVDDQGAPAPFALPPTAKLLPALTLQGGDGGVQVKPFFASAGLGPDAGQHANVILMMIDISGSMNDPSPGGTSRFNAVKTAIARYLEAMQEGTDEIAIVPFESHNVVSTIRSAVFSNRKADLLAQLNALPQPTPKNNTALYQAVFTGVESVRNELSALERDGHAASELQPHLILMTDGKNEVMAGDDPLLLNGPLGLQQAASQVLAAHIDVVGVGFGDRAAIDAVALQRLSTRFFYAADASQLLDALHVTRTTQSHVIQMAWLLPEQNRIAVTGHDQTWAPSLTLKDGRILTAPSVRVVVPATATPLFQRDALPAELVALIATHPPAGYGWSIVLVHLLLFLGVAILLIVLWFWIPRLIWNESFMNATNAQRWSNGQTPVLTTTPLRGTPLPAGFTPEAQPSGPLQRSPAQTTQVGPRPDKARTRLNFD